MTCPQLGEVLRLEPGRTPGGGDRTVDHAWAIRTARPDVRLDFAEGAALNVKINLPGITDEKFVDDLEANLHWQDPYDVDVHLRHYLPKPADADAIEAALLSVSDALPPPPENPMSADRVRWEHIQRVFEQCDRNVSETARRLNMHRRTLQRILNKYAPRR